MTGSGVGGSFSSGSSGSLPRHCSAAWRLPLEALVAARALQGIGGALLTPGSLAILQASFAPGDRARAVGAWSGLSGIAAAIGPFVGGWLVGLGSWRLIFLINVPLAIAAVAVALRYVPETRDPAPSAASTSRAPRSRLWAWPGCPGRSSMPASGARAGRRWRRRRRPGRAGRLRRGGAAWSSPDAAARIFRSRQFTAANLVTFVVYASLGITFFLLIVNLQQVLGYSPMQAGLATLPVTVLMLVLSARAGLLADRIGPRLPMTVGPLGIAAGLVLLSRVQEGATYLGTVLPG